MVQDNNHDTGKTIHSSFVDSDFSTLNTNFYPNYSYSSPAESVRKLSSGGLYLSRSLTFFINHFQQREYEIKNKPSLSITYDPHSDVDTYTPKSELLNASGNSTGVSRKFLKVKVENSGGGAAEHCNATLKVSPLEASVKRTPSKEAKLLLWESNQIYEDIGVHNYAMLHVVFSDSRDGLIADDYCAFVSTPDNIQRVATLAQHAFGENSFIIQLEVKSKKGDYIRAFFRLNVTKSWGELSMERIT